MAFSEVQRVYLSVSVQEQWRPLKFGLYLCASVLQDVLDRLPLVHQLFVEFRGDFLLLDHALAGLQVRHLLLGGQHTGMVSYINTFFPCTTQG